MASTGDKLVYFLAGGFVGAAVAVLFAPKSGEQTREFLENKYREGTERMAARAREGKEILSEKSAQATERVSGTLNKSKEILEKQKEQIVAAIDAGKTAYSQEKAGKEAQSPRVTKKK